MEDIKKEYIYDVLFTMSKWFFVFYDHFVKKLTDRSINYDGEKRGPVSTSDRRDRINEVPITLKGKATYLHFSNSEKNEFNFENCNDLR